MVEINETSSIPTDQYNQFMPKEKFTFPKATMQKVKSTITSLNSGLVTDTFKNSASTPFTFLINPNPNCVFDLSQAYFNIAGELKVPEEIAAIYTKDIKLGNLFILSLFQQAQLALGGAVIANNQNPGIDANMQAALKFDEYDLIHKTVSDREFLLNQLKSTFSQDDSIIPTFPAGFFTLTGTIGSTKCYGFSTTQLPEYAGQEFLFLPNAIAQSVQIFNDGAGATIDSTNLYIQFDDSGFGRLVSFVNTPIPNTFQTEISDNPEITNITFKAYGLEDGFVEDRTSCIPLYIARPSGDAQNPNTIPFRCKLYLSDLFNYTVDTLDYVFNREVSIVLQRSSGSSIIANVMSLLSSRNFSLEVSKIKKFELIAYSYVLTDTARNQLLSYYSKDIETIFGVQTTNLTPLYNFDSGTEQNITLPLTVNYDTKCLLLAFPKCSNPLTPLSTRKNILITRQVDGTMTNDNSIQASWFGSNSNSYNFGGLRYIRISNTSNSNIYTYDFTGTGLEYINPSQLDKSYDVSNSADGSKSFILDYREAYNQYKQLRLLFGKDPDNSLSYENYLKDYCIIPVDLTGSNIPPNTRIFVNFQFAQWGDHYRPMKYGNVENNGNNISTNLLAISLGSDVLVYQKDGTCIVKHILSPSTTEKNVNLK